MKIAFIGDIVGRPGRKMVKQHLKHIREEFNIDFVIANTENASHGFGLTTKNSTELFNSGIDLMTGGNHTWDKRDILPLLEVEPILRPHNYPEGVVGSGLFKCEVVGEKLAILNLMGVYTMPMVTNPFLCAKETIEKLHSEGYKNIFIDFHAEATSEKRAMHQMFKGKVSAICGTHTHIGTDDLTIESDTLYVTDVGLSGCRNNVIGMDSDEPIKKFLTGLPAKYDIPNKCKSILQLIVIELEDGKAIDGFKIKAYDEAKPQIVQMAFKERS